MASSIYIHIPFCAKKCLYCDFYSVILDEDLAEAYVKALCKELELRKNDRDGLKTIYIGGGTPSLLSIASFEKIFSSLRQYFRLDAGAEITVEVNPGTIDKEKIEALLSFGVNRISIGVQSLDDRELQMLGRIHSADEAEQAIKMIKKAGIDNISIDLIYGIPGQTEITWHDTLRRALALSPFHISAYELTPELHTPFYSLISSETVRMPEEELILSFYDQAIDTLSSHGYHHYEISNFALPGQACMHNLNYWDLGEYIGAGAGAHSFLNGIRSNNAADIRRYIEALQKDTFIPVEEAFQVSPEETAREFLFLGLRKTEGVSISSAKEFGIDLSGAFHEFADNGYIEMVDGYLRLTRKGLKISNTVFVKLFEILGL